MVPSARAHRHCDDEHTGDHGRLMRRLTGTDSLFLAMETPAWHQHVGGVTILDPGPEGLSFDAVVERIAERIRYSPKFTWKLARAPLSLDRPVWVDDPDFDVRNHLRRIRVPSPGGAREVGEVVGALVSRQLDRSRPLWEVWILDGVAGGRVAFVLKYHHCLLDGMAGADLATTLFDVAPEATKPLVPEPSEEEQRAGGIDRSEVAWGLLGRGVRLPLSWGSYAVNLGIKGALMANQWRSDIGSRTILHGPRTRLNGEVGRRRQMTFASVALADVVALKSLHGVKLNDVVLALCAGAIRDYLLSIGDLPELPLTCSVPVSTRDPDDHTQDNQVSSMFVSLATDVADPVDRLLAIHSSSQSAKEMAKAMSTHQIQSLGDVASPLLLGQAFKAVWATQLMSKGPLRTNTVVSNVPGPPVPLYLAGARVTGIFPSSVILAGMGTNFTVLSNVDRLDIGLHVDPDLVEDPWHIADAVPGALADLMAASGLGPPSPVEDAFGMTAGSS